MLRLLILITLLCSPLVLQAQVKIGFVDLHKTVQSTSTGKKARQDLDSEYTRKKKDLDQQESQLRKKDNELEAKKLAMTEAAYRKQRADLEKKVSDFRDLMGRTQIEFQKKELELTTPILEKIRKVIAKVAKQNGYTVVLEMTSQILYSPDGDDLTERVIRDFENEP